MTDTNATIRSKIDAFLQEIEAMTRAAALDAVRTALAGGSPSTAPRTDGRRVARRAAPKVATQRKGRKRTSEQVDATAAKVLAYVKSNAGSSVEQIGKALRMATQELALPILKLKAERAVRTTGQKRGTKYFAGGAASKPKRAAPKAVKKRKPMAPAQRAALLERLAHARAAKLAAAK